MVKDAPLYNRVSVTDRTKPTACVATQLSREQYQTFEERAFALGMNKGTLLRQLVSSYLSEQ